MPIQFEYKLQCDVRTRDTRRRHKKKKKTRTTGKYHKTTIADLQNCRIVAWEQEERDRNDH